MAINNLYNIFWKFLDKKINEKFKDPTNQIPLDLCEYKSFFSGLFEPNNTEFPQWVTLEWLNKSQGDILSMSEVIETVKYISHHKWLVYEGGFDKPDDFIRDLSVNELFNHYGKAIIYFESAKLADNISAILNELNNPTPKLPINRKRKGSDISDEETTNKKIKIEDDHDIIYSNIRSKMEKDTKFDDWVTKEMYLRPYATRPKPFDKITPPQKLKRQTNEPRCMKLARLCLKHGHSFQQIVNRFNYDMSRVELDSVKSRLKIHYPDGSESDLEIMATDCVNKLIHPDDYDFNLIEDVTEWNTRLDLIPTTSKKRRRSKRLNNGKRLKIS